MRKIYKAHINEFTKAIQTVKEHSENTAELCRDFAVPPLKDLAYAMGLLHDVGKFQESFQKRIDGADIRVEHSTCGAIVANEKYKGIAGLMMAYCIAGHHSGLPNAGYRNDGSYTSTLHGRLKRDDFDDYSAYKEELVNPILNQKDFQDFLAKDCNMNISILVDKFSFITRYCFSCLTDADSIDTSKFCGTQPERRLSADFIKCLEKVNKKLDSFVCKTELQKTRSRLQSQVFNSIEEEAEIYLMNMPTGSGKTLCSVKFALEKAIREKKKRIIYIIPFNSIIDQTAGEFEDIFGEDAEILRHQSSFSYEDEDNYSEDYREAAKNAAENWDAPFIITTAVQFFESIYANKRGKLRKLHNMADSILIFDEAHLMPQEYLQPCLQSIAFLTKYFNSKAVFLTATMPDFHKLMKQYALPGSKILNLIDDISSFDKFKKCQYNYIGEVEDETLLSNAAQYPSSLIIVNTKKKARELYKACNTKKYHLSTYMTAFDRKRIIDEIKRELLRLSEEFEKPEQVPENRKITIISTSLIEAGVDLDVHTVFRELSGLDSILQAGGRCNREGKRAEANTYIFEFTDQSKKTAQDERKNLTKGIINKYEDISCPESISEYYDRLFFMKADEIQKNTMSSICQDIMNIPFKDYSEKFKIIDSLAVSVFVERDEESHKLVEQLRYTGSCNTRKMQKNICSISPRELEDLAKQHAVEDFNTGIWCLTNSSYYDKDTGIIFEANDYIV